MQKLFALLKSEHIGAKECRQKMAEILIGGKAKIVTVNGVPRKIMIPYQQMIDIVELVATQEKELARAS